MSSLTTLRDRVSGKWQFPLLGLSLVCLAGSILFSRPTPKPIPVATLISQLEGLVEGGAHGRALRLGESLLARSDATSSERASIRTSCARAQFRQAVSKGLETGSVGGRVVEHYQAAEADGAALQAEDYERWGRALAWRGQFAASAEFLERAASGGIANSWDLRKEILTLQRDRLDAPAHKLDVKFADFLRDLPVERLDLRLWAIEQRLDLLEELGRLREATSLLAENSHLYADSALRERFEFLDSLRLYRLGDYDQAEVRLRTLRNQVDPSDEVAAMAGWLLGRVVLSDGGPQRPLEAASFFGDVLRHHSTGPYADASLIGQAEALAMQDRHEEAIHLYEAAVKRLKQSLPSHLVDRMAVSASLGVAAEAQRRNGQLEVAVGYARMAAELADRDPPERACILWQHFADLARQLAEQASQTEESGEMTGVDAGRRLSGPELFAEAGKAYLDIAELNVFDERRASEANWKGAECYARAGDTSQAVKLFEEFVRDRPEDPFVPRAWLRVGQLRHAARQLKAAVGAYQECYRRFPRTLDGARALVPLARCYVSLGSESLPKAEDTLRIVLEESEVFTPDAPEFADALFLLGDVLLRRGEFERSIGTLEEALDRYPSDDRVSRSRFLLADAHRQSATALREEVRGAAFEGEISALRRESVVRWMRARRLYRDVIEDYESQPSRAMGRLDRMYLRHAYLYEADCLFETQDYASALKLYEEAAGNYREASSGLTAYVQIINCQVFLGQPEEARAALARALVLADAMPASAFEGSISPETRTDWKQYFEWLGTSGLF